MKKGIDVSGYQGTINWNKVKSNGIEFAILKFGNIYDNQTNDKDNKFETYYKSAKSNGLKLGCYIYNYCNTNDNLKKGLDWVFKNLKNKEFDLPIYLDMEDKDIQNETKESLTNMCNEFAKYVKNKGYKAGVYANLNWLKNELNPENFDKDISVWVAQYYKECEYTGKYDIWQYTSEGSVNGISGNVDMNYLINEDLFEKTNLENTEKVITTVTVTHEKGLNLRKSANTSSQIMKAFEKGTTLKIYEIKNNWGRTDGGWVCLDYTSYSKKTENLGNVKYTTGRYGVNTDVLTVRSAPGTDNKWLLYSELTENAQKQVLEKCGYKPNGLCRGVYIDVTKVEENWGKIPSGWVCLDYCKKV